MQSPIVVSSLAEEYRCLDRWFGTYRLLGRGIEYASEGRVFDVLDVGVQGNKIYRVTFDATKIRPMAPAAAALPSPNTMPSWVFPAVIAAGVVGLVYLSKRRR